MNWIATNIRFPEDQYQKLKYKAAKERRSIASVVREATAKEVNPEETKSELKLKAKKFMAKLEKIAQGNAKYTKGFDSVKALREIRYSE